MQILNINVLNKTISLLSELNNYMTDGGERASEMDDSAKYVS